MKIIPLIIIITVLILTPPASSANWQSFLHGASEESGRRLDCDRRYNQIIEHQTMVIEDLQRRLRHKERIIQQLESKK
jgi:hypothetical protein